MQKLRSSLEDSVKKQLMCDVPYGVLISGGLDSSIISAIAAKYSKSNIVLFELTNESYSARARRNRGWQR